MKKNVDTTLNGVLKLKATSSCNLEPKLKRMMKKCARQRREKGPLKSRRKLASSIWVHCCYVKLQAYSTWQDLMTPTVIPHNITASSETRGADSNRSLEQEEEDKVERGHRAHHYHTTYHSGKFPYNFCHEMSVPTETNGSSMIRCSGNITNNSNDVADRSQLTQARFRRSIDVSKSKGKQLLRQKANCSPETNAIRKALESRQEKRVNRSKPWKTSMPHGHQGGHQTFIHATKRLSGPTLKGNNAAKAHHPLPSTKFACGEFSMPKFISPPQSTEFACGEFNSTKVSSPSPSMKFACGEFKDNAVNFEPETESWPYKSTLMEGKDTYLIKNEQNEVTMSSDTMLQCSSLKEPRKKKNTENEKRDNEVDRCRALMCKEPRPSRIPIHVFRTRSKKDTKTADENLDSLSLSWKSPCESLNFQSVFENSQTQRSNCLSQRMYRNGSVIQMSSTQTTRQRSLFQDLRHEGRPRELKYKEEIVKKVQAMVESYTKFLEREGVMKGRSLDYKLTETEKSLPGFIEGLDKLDTSHEYLHQPCDKNERDKNPIVTKETRRLNLTDMNGSLHANTSAIHHSVGSKPGGCFSRGFARETKSAMNRHKSLLSASGSQGRLKPPTGKGSSSRCCLDNHHPIQSADIKNKPGGDVKGPYFPDDVKNISSKEGYLEARSSNGKLRIQHELWRRDEKLSKYSLDRRNNRSLTRGKGLCTKDHFPKGSGPCVRSSLTRPKHFKEHNAEISKDGQARDNPTSKGRAKTHNLRRGPSLHLMHTPVLGHERKGHQGKSRNLKVFPSENILRNTQQPRQEKLRNPSPRGIHKKISKLKTQRTRVREDAPSFPQRAFQLDNYVHDKTTNGSKDEKFSPNENDTQNKEHQERSFSTDSEICFLTNVGSIFSENSRNDTASNAWRVRYTSRDDSVIAINPAITSPQPSVEWWDSLPAGQCLKRKNTESPLTSNNAAMGLHNFRKESCNFGKAEHKSDASTSSWKSVEMSSLSHKIPYRSSPCWKKTLAGMEEAWLHGSKESEATSSGEHRQSSPALTAGFMESSSKSTMKGISDLTYTSIESLPINPQNVASRDLENLTVMSDSAIVYFKPDKAFMLTDEGGNFHIRRFHSDIYTGGDVLQDSVSNTLKPNLIGLSAEPFPSSIVLQRHVHSNRMKRRLTKSVAFLRSEKYSCKNIPTCTIKKTSGEKNIAEKKSPWLLQNCINVIRGTGQLQQKEKSSSSSRVQTPAKVIQVSQTPSDQVSTKLSLKNLPDKFASLTSSPGKDTSMIDTSTKVESELDQPTEKGFQKLLHFWEDKFTLTRIKHSNDQKPEKVKEMDGITTARLKLQTSRDQNYSDAYRHRLGMQEVAKERRKGDKQRGAHASTTYHDWNTSAFASIFPFGNAHQCQCQPEKVKTCHFQLPLLKNSTSFQKGTHFESNLEQFGKGGSRKKLEIKSLEDLSIPSPGRNTCPATFTTKHRENKCKARKGKERPFYEDSIIRKKIPKDISDLLINMLPTGKNVHPWNSSGGRKDVTSNNSKQKHGMLDVEQTNVTERNDQNIGERDGCRFHNNFSQIKCNSEKRKDFLELLKNIRQVKSDSSMCLDTIRDTTKLDTPFGWTESISKQFLNEALARKEKRVEKMCPITSKNGTHFLSPLDNYFIANERQEVKLVHVSEVNSRQSGVNHIHPNCVETNSNEAHKYVHPIFVTAESPTKAVHSKPRHSQDSFHASAPGVFPSMNKDKGHLKAVFLYSRGYKPRLFNTDYQKPAANKVYSQSKQICIKNGRQTITTKAHKTKSTAGSNKIHRPKLCLGESPSDKKNTCFSKNNLGETNLLIGETITEKSKGPLICIKEATNHCFESTDTASSTYQCTRPEVTERDTMENHIELLKDTSLLKTRNIVLNTNPHPVAKSGFLTKLCSRESSPSLHHSNHISSTSQCVTRNVKVSENESKGTISGVRKTIRLKNELGDTNKSEESKDKQETVKTNLNVKNKYASCENCSSCQKCNSCQKCISCQKHTLCQQCSLGGARPRTKTKGSQVESHLTLKHDGKCRKVKATNDSILATSRLSVDGDDSRIKTLTTTPLPSAATSTTKLYQFLKLHEHVDTPGSGQWLSSKGIQVTATSLQETNSVSFSKRDLKSLESSMTATKPANISNQAKERPSHSKNNGTCIHFPNISFPNNKQVSTERKASKSVQEVEILIGKDIPVERFVDSFINGLTGLTNSSINYNYEGKENHKHNRPNSLKPCGKRKRKRRSLPNTSASNKAGCVLISSEPRQEGLTAKEYFPGAPNLVHRRPLTVTAPFGKRDNILLGRQRIQARRFKELERDRFLRGLKDDSSGDTLNDDKLGRRFVETSVRKSMKLHEGEKERHRCKKNAPVMNSLLKKGPCRNEDSHVVREHLTTSQIQHCSRLGEVKPLTKVKREYITHDIDSDFHSLRDENANLKTRRDQVDSKSMPDTYDKQDAAPETPKEDVEQNIHVYAPCCFSTTGKSVQVLVTKNMGYKRVQLSLTDNETKKGCQIIIEPRDKQTFLSPKVETKLGFVHVKFYPTSRNGSSESNRNHRHDFRQFSRSRNSSSDQGSHRLSENFMTCVRDEDFGKPSIQYARLANPNLGPMEIKIAGEDKTLNSSTTDPVLHFDAHCSSQSMNRKRRPYPSWKAHGKKCSRSCVDDSRRNTKVLASRMVDRSNAFTTPESCMKRSRVANRPLNTMGFSPNMFCGSLRYNGIAKHARAAEKYTMPPWDKYTVVSPSRLERFSRKRLEEYAELPYNSLQIYTRAAPCKSNKRSNFHSSRNTRQSDSVRSVDYRGGVSFKHRRTTGTSCVTTEVSPRSPIDCSKLASSPCPMASYKSRSCGTETARTKDMSTSPGRTKSLLSATVCKDVYPRDNLRFRSLEHNRPTQGTRRPVRNTLVCSQYASGYNCRNSQRGFKTQVPTKGRIKSCRYSPCESHSMTYTCQPCCVAYAGPQNSREGIRKHCLPAMGFDRPYIASVEEICKSQERESGKSLQFRNCDDNKQKQVICDRTKPMSVEQESIVRTFPRGVIGVAQQEVTPDMGYPCETIHDSVNNDYRLKTHDHGFNYDSHDDQWRRACHDLREGCEPLYRHVKYPCNPAIMDEGRNVFPCLQKPPNYVTLSTPANPSSVKLRSQRPFLGLAGREMPRKYYPSTKFLSEFEIPRAPHAHGVEHSSKSCRPHPDSLSNVNNFEYHPLQDRSYVGCTPSKSRITGFGKYVYDPTYVRNEAVVSDSGMRSKSWAYPRYYPTLHESMNIPFQNSKSESLEVQYSRDVSRPSSCQEELPSQPEPRAFLSAMETPQVSYGRSTQQVSRQPSYHKVMASQPGSRVTFSPYISAAVTPQISTVNSADQVSHQSSFHEQMHSQLLTEANFTPASAKTTPQTSRRSIPDQVSCQSSYYITTPSQPGSRVTFSPCVSTMGTPQMSRVNSTEKVSPQSSFHEEMHSPPLSKTNFTLSASAKTTPQMSRRGTPDQVSRQSSYYGATPSQPGSSAKFSSSVSVMGTPQMDRVSSANQVSRQPSHLEVMASQPGSRATVTPSALAQDTTRIIQTDNMDQISRQQSCYGEMAYQPEARAQFTSSASARVTPQVSRRCSTNQISRQPSGLQEMASKIESMAKFTPSNSTRGSPQISRTYTKDEASRQASNPDERSIKSCSRTNSFQSGYTKSTPQPSRTSRAHLVDSWGEPTQEIDRDEIQNDYSRAEIREGLHEPWSNQWLPSDCKNKTCGHLSLEERRKGLSRKDSYLSRSREACPSPRNNLLRAISGVPSSRLEPCHPTPFPINSTFPPIPQATHTDNYDPMQSPYRSRHRSQNAATPSTGPEDSGYETPERNAGFNLRRSCVRFKEHNSTQSYSDIPDLQPSSVDQGRTHFYVQKSTENDRRFAEDDWESPIVDMSGRKSQRRPSGEADISGQKLAQSGQRGISEWDQTIIDNVKRRQRLLDHGFLL